MFDIERVRTSWRNESAAIDAVVRAMSAEAARQPVREDGWTAHDLLGHIASSAYSFVHFLKPDAPPPPDGPVDIHDINAQRLQRNRDRPWAEVLAYWQHIRDDVAAFLEASTNDLGTQPIRLPWVPSAQNAGDVLRVLILHTRSHREELVRGTAMPVEE
ncbi:MAG TPA: DinB family protein [Herpetosiphonaceae bacterium]